MFTSSWNPFLAHQEHPLDLSVKNKGVIAKVNNVKNAQNSFDFAKFYLTYYKIASRSSPAYLSHDNHGPAQNSSTIRTEFRRERKRKFSDNSSETEGKKVKIDNICENPSDKDKDIKNRKSQNKENSRFPSIKDTCDCRFCYEDHIIKMRLKTERPWLKC